jgi:hypothetical protein
MDEAEWAPRVSLDSVDKEKNSCPGSEPNLIQPEAINFNNWAILAQFKMEKKF